MFFAGLFIMVGVLVNTGVIGQVAEAGAAAARGDALVAIPYLWLRYFLLPG